MMPANRGRVPKLNRQRLVATCVALALLASAFAAVAVASPASSQRRSPTITPLSATGCTDGTFIHSTYTRIDGANNDIYDDCEALVAIQNALAADSLNNVFTDILNADHPLRTWGKSTQHRWGFTTTQKLASDPVATFPNRNWYGANVGYDGTDTLRVRGLLLNGLRSSSLPSQIGNLTGLTGITLRDNHFTSLPTTISNLTNLEGFDLTNNTSLTSFSLPRKIAGETGLTSLTVIYSQSLTSIPSSIGDHTELERISITRTGITSLPSTIGNLTKLDRLDIGNNNSLASLPSEIGNLRKLISLSLGVNQSLGKGSLTSLPTTIGNLTNLGYLSASNQSLTSLPTTIGSLSNKLESLHLGDNSLTSLPSTIWNLTNLTELTLHDNRLTSLPSQIGNLTKLYHLYLSENRFTSLPSQIGNLTNLTELTLHDNRLLSLNPEIGNLTNLTELTLHDNNLPSLPAAITNLTNLTELTLNDNRLTSLPSQLRQLSSLTKLDVRNNRLTSVAPIAGLMSTLRELHICPQQANVVISRYIKEARLPYSPRTLRDINNCGTVVDTWNIVSTPRTITSPQNLAGDLGLLADRSVWRWNAVNQVWSDVALVSSVPEGTALAYLGLASEDDLREALNPGEPAGNPDERNPGIAKEDVTVTFSNGWNIVKSPPVPRNPSGLQLFDMSLLDCSAPAGAIITFVLDIASGNWQVHTPCHPSVQRSLTANDRYSPLTQITKDDVLYIYFVSALPTDISWDADNNIFQPA